MEKVYCIKCGKECIPEGIGAGYGVMPETGEKVCYACCGELDKQSPALSKSRFSRVREVITLLGFVMIFGLNLETMRFTALLMATIHKSRISAA